MNKNNNNKEEIRELVKLYFEYNPQNNKGIGYRAKAYDIISSYLNTHNKKYEDIKKCIESNPIHEKPIWDLFYNYFKNTKKLEKSNYKSSIKDSTNVNDWI